MQVMRFMNVPGPKLRFGIVCLVILMRGVI
jgi:hypothetical protein